MNERFLPIGIQDFEDLRSRGCIYVDKTDLIYKLATEGKPYFLSRPRRFGKSLLLSTMEAYFLGKKELFKGLAIETLEKEWIEYPVLKISFGVNSYENNERLRSRLDSIVSENEARYNIEKQSDDPAERFANIIREVSKKFNQKLVILIDEYDKPILDALYTEFEEQNRQELRSFYSPLKDSDKYIRFLFITGITKVSHVNIFSGLNQLNDISLNQDFSTICGVSETELENYFLPEIQALAEKQGLSVAETKNKLAEMYDGYHFAYESEGIYNPFCLLKCFYEKMFGSYWFESGTPSFLAEKLKNKTLELENFVKGKLATKEQFMNFNPDGKNMLPLIYQYGCLTIKDFEKEMRFYTLDFPNREVEEGFLDVLLQKFVSVPYDDVGLEINNLRIALKNCNIDKVLSIIKAAIADLPTVVKKNMCENYYESVTHLMFRMTGMRVVSELQSVAGRSDVVVATKDSVFIFELKMDKGRPFEEVAEDALKQIDDNGYCNQFAVSGKKMLKVGVVFSSEGKGMVGWKVK